MWETDWLIWPIWFGLFIEWKSDYFVTIAVGPLLITRYKVRYR